MPLAFKHFNDDGEMDFLPLMSEVLTLSQLPIRSHPNIVNLEGIFFEIKAQDGESSSCSGVWNATWDLKQFMNVSEGINMTIDGRLKIYVNIGSAIMTLHAYGLSFHIEFDRGSLIWTQMSFMAMLNHKTC
jgi:hypothetical protein